ncbi:hypothetical protein LWI28_015117 [Acer negundo]|uniref:Fe2OG dioxygenase domain-containing protein n=1 Tax=Acer negundo TaxID=4023 RepID=A0AAD5II21_ACENE|nr:hypothetical protein LWI28_015117 [Acer negundo]
MGSQTLPKLPVIDFSKEDLKPGTQTWFSTCKEICQALEEHGCFIVECKDVSLDLHNKIFDAAKELHDLPIDVKKKNFSDKPFRGYFSASSVHESLGIDNVIALESTQNFTKLMWPHGNDLFCTKANKIARTMIDLDQMVIRMVFESYGVEKYYDSHIVSTDYVLRFNKYKEYIEDNIGLPIHTDKTLTTIIHQNHINGLEVQISDGEWVTYDPPSHSSFLYFAGVAFQVWSNNRIHPCSHRVSLSSKEARHTLGLVTFHNGVIRIPNQFVDDQHPLKYKPFDHLDYLRQQMIYSRTHKAVYPIEAYCGL